MDDLDFDPNEIEGTGAFNFDGDFSLTDGNPMIDETEDPEVPIDYQMPEEEERNSKDSDNDNANDMAVEEYHDDEQDEDDDLDFKQQMQDFNAVRPYDQKRDSIFKGSVLESFT